MSTSFTYIKRSYIYVTYMYTHLTKEDTFILNKIRIRNRSRRKKIVHNLEELHMSQNDEHTLH